MNDVNYDGWLGLGLFFSVAILVILGIYGMSEPDQRAATEAKFTAERVERGVEIYAENCTQCHGEGGEGTRRDGPALNTVEYLTEANDQSIFGVIADGRPNTAMPAWGQDNGGPFTAEETKDLTAFIRAWEPTAPPASETQLVADPVGGAVLYSVTCYGCHGVNGEGTETVPALNDLKKLATFDDAWYRQTIATGRSAQGMPTWGKVLSPTQINDLVAYIRRWEKSAAAAPPSEPEGDPASGAAVFEATCAVRHGQYGDGTDRAPMLNSSETIAAHDDAFYRDVVTEGRLEQGMPRWGQVLSPGVVNDLVALIRSWESVEASTADAGSGEPAPDTSGEELAADASSEEPAADPGGGAPEVDSELLAQGQQIYDFSAGGVGCAYCHGLDGRGQGESGEDAPDIRGMTTVDTKQAIGDVESMKFIELSKEETAAVGAYLQYLAK